ncbi:hypothetical protein PULV_a0303 [Pseudoalteromonas ulvae UL12]|nr:hypothetical protein [Pseudoalteromonas ulvae UL12]
MDELQPQNSSGLHPSLAAHALATTMLICKAILKTKHNS